MNEIDVDWNKLATRAWDVRDNSFLMGTTAVGAALIASNGEIFSGCNVEQRYRVLDVHAEVNAITNMVASGQKSFYAILVAAERKRFTPCGSCLDWIIQFGGLQCLVGYQTNRNSNIIIHTAHELMPYYPE
jgi:cytidine deaminase